MVVESQIEQKIICTETHRSKQFPCQKDMQGPRNTKNQIVLNDGACEEHLKKSGHEPFSKQSSLTIGFLPREARSTKTETKSQVG